jgi:hypothetical protein
LECPRFSPWSDWRNTLAVFIKFFSLIDRRGLYILCIPEAHGLNVGTVIGCFTDF